MKYDPREVWVPDDEDKIYDYQDIPEIARYIRSIGRYGILAPGVFDIMHPGHAQFFREARKLGIFVFAGLENDEAVRYNKGSTRPINSLEDRLMMVASNSSVGAVFGFPDVVPYDKPEGHIERYRFLGIDIAVPYDDPNYDLKMWQALQADVGVVPIYKESTPNSTTQILAQMGNPQLRPRQP
jgi:cytidyltransferase-like protein